MSHKGNIFSIYFKVILKKNGQMNEILLLDEIFLKNLLLTLGRYPIKSNFFC